LKREHRMYRLDAAPLPQKVMKIGPKSLRTRDAAIPLIGGHHRDLSSDFSAGAPCTLPVQKPSQNGAARNFHRVAETKRVSANAEA
jgi:hypothetical protein